MPQSCADRPFNGGQHAPDSGSYILERGVSIRRNDSRKIACSGPDGGGSVWSGISISSSGKDSVCNPEKIAIDVGTPYAIVFDFDVLHHNSVEYLDRLKILQGEDALLKDAKDLSLQMKGTENLKISGINALNGGLKVSVIELIERFKDFGIFIVPIGTLESWLEIESDKKSYPEKFIVEYSTRKEECKNLHEFLKEIEGYLKVNFVA